MTLVRPLISKVKRPHLQLTLEKAGAEMKRTKEHGSVEIKWPVESYAEKA